MSKKASPRGSYTPTRDMRRILVRVPSGLADWVDDTADAMGLSRDLFVRELLEGTRAAFVAMGKKGTPESRFMAQVRDQVGAAIGEAFDESVTRVVKLSASGVRNQPRPRRRSS